MLPSGKLIFLTPPPTFSGLLSPLPPKTPSTPNLHILNSFFNRSPSPLVRTRSGDWEAAGTETLRRRRREGEVLLVVEVKDWADGSRDMG